GRKTQQRARSHGGARRPNRGAGGRHRRADRARRRPRAELAVVRRVPAGPAGAVRRYADPAGGRRCGELRARSPGGKGRSGGGAEVRVMDALLQDLRHALRRLRRAPTFAVTAVLILGIGIGMATAMFTIFHAVVLRKLPVRDPDRILVLWTLRDPTVELPLDVNEVDELRRESRTLKDVAGFGHWGAQAVPLTQGDRPIVLKQAMVTAGLFDVLGARPVLGRLLQADDGVVGAARVAVISYEAWQR